MPGVSPGATGAPIRPPAPGAERPAGAVVGTTYPVAVDAIRKVLVDDHGGGETSYWEDEWAGLDLEATRAALLAGDPVLRLLERHLDGDGLVLEAQERVADVARDSGTDELALQLVSGGVPHTPEPVTLNRPHRTTRGV